MRVQRSSRSTVLVTAGDGTSGVVILSEKKIVVKARTPAAHQLTIPLTPLSRREFAKHQQETCLHGPGPTPPSAFINTSNYPRKAIFALLFYLTRAKTTNPRSPPRAMDRAITPPPPPPSNMSDIFRADSCFDAHSRDARYYRHYLYCNSRSCGQPKSGSF